MGRIEFFEVFLIGFGHKKPLQQPSIKIGHDEGQIDRKADYDQIIVTHFTPKNTIFPPLWFFKIKVFHLFRHKKRLFSPQIAVFRHFSTVITTFFNRMCEVGVLLRRF
jgi:hypothetical protein